MFRAPLIMAALFLCVAVLAGIVVGAPGPFAAVAVLGFIVTLPLGYAYVAVTVLLRRVLGSR